MTEKPPAPEPEEVERGGSLSWYFLWLLLALVILFEVIALKQWIGS